ncbi:gelsolin-related protein of 125 kDa-like [Macrobrachium rosenbergii]|uniref:gelsolin-related protein of 125 kDa-like n=1 Tax=Macrobrachium rosenbergii TaxID=79674 RepID=UPI0034D405D2
MAGEKEKLNGLLVERELEMSSVRRRVEDEKEKNQLVNEEVLVMKIQRVEVNQLKNWIEELKIAGEKERLKDLLVERELKISSMRQRVEDEKEKNQLVNEDVQLMKKWIAELEGENEKLKDRLADMEKEENAVKKISNEDKEGYYQEENEEAHELEWETSNQEEVEIIEENQGRRKEDTEFEEERLAVVNQGNEAAVSTLRPLGIQAKFPFRC